MTVKDRITFLLQEDFPSEASYPELFEAINKKWEDFSIKNLSPHLTRLKNKNILMHDKDNGIWRLCTNHTPKEKDSRGGSQESLDISYEPIPAVRKVGGT